MMKLLLATLVLANAMTVVYFEYHIKGVDKLTINFSLPLGSMGNFEGQEDVLK